MAERQTVKEAWESFEKEVIPDDAGPYQLQEMRRAFYGGAWAMWNMASAIGQDSVSEEEGVARFEAWRKELRQFQMMMIMGRR